MFPLTVRGASRKAAEARAESALELVDLAGYGSRATHELSGGQQQRVALARAIVFEPPILLMDEPLSALDKNLRERMQIEIRQLHRRLGMTTVYVTHDQREALTMSDRVAILNRGRIEQYATPEQIYDEPGSAFVADFMGETSLIPVRIEGGRAVFANHRLILPSIPAGQDDYALVLRPERLVLLEPGRGTPDGSNLLSGTVADRVFQGESLLYLITLADGEQFTYRAQGKSSSRERMPEPGMIVNFALDVEDTLVVPRPP
jgi:putative spermidine/putrescine transport system ATP-binding protein